MRKFLLAAALAVATSSSAVAEEVSIKCKFCFVEDVRVAFDAIWQCEEEHGSWHCKDLIERLLGEIKEKYNLGDD